MPASPTPSEEAVGGGIDELMPTASPAIVELAPSQPGYAGYQPLGLFRFGYATNLRDCRNSFQPPGIWPVAFNPLRCPVVTYFTAGQVIRVWGWGRAGADRWGWLDGLGWLSWAACYRGYPRGQFYPGAAMADDVAPPTLTAPVDPCRIAP